MSGIPSGYTTIYQIKGETIIPHELCEASGIFKKKIEVSGETLLIRQVAACRSGYTDDSCDEQLPMEQKKNDKNPTRLKWNGKKFVNISKTKAK